MTDAHPVTDETVRARLERAAEYLESLDDERFTMAQYADYGATPEDILHSSTPHCGCVIGHIPRIDPALTRRCARSIDTGADLTWESLADAFLAGALWRDTALYEWVFSAGWQQVDGTRQGAIERIRVALDQGVPHAFHALDTYPERYARESPGAPCAGTQAA